MLSLVNYYESPYVVLYPTIPPRRPVSSNMTALVLSEAERIFIQHGVEEGLRCDGRGRGDVRPVVLETGVVSHAR